MSAVDLIEQEIQHVMFERDKLVQEYKATLKELQAKYHEALGGQKEADQDGTEEAKS